MAQHRFGVGIIGLQPQRSWAALAHVPALLALPETFEIVGVANTSKASAEAAVAATGLAKAYDSVAALIAAPDVDIVAITVRVPHHLRVARAALEAGKHVFCEWPLGNGLAEAEQLAELARARGVHCVVGTQVVLAPEIQYLKQLLAEGALGEVLSTSLVAFGDGWGGVIANQRISAYLVDQSMGATMLTIPVGHTLAGLTYLLGDIAELSATLAVRRKTAIALDTGETLPVTAPDQVLVQGLLAGGAPFSLHFRGGPARDGDGLFWEINGTEADVRISGASGETQMVQLSLSASKRGDKALLPLEVPARYRDGFPQAAAPGNVARLYALMASDLRNGTRNAPGFDDAVRIHRIIAAIEEAAESGRRVKL